MVKNTKSYEAFEGAVHFELYPYDTIRSTLLARKFLAAVPEYATWDPDGVEMRLFSSMINVFGVLDSLTIKLPKTDASDELVGFKQWWDMARLSKDYQAIWEGFLNLSQAVYDEWCEAYNSTRKRIIEAEPVLAVGSDQQAVDDPDFLAESSSESLNLSPA